MFDEDHHHVSLYIITPVMPRCGTVNPLRQTLAVKWNDANCRRTRRLFETYYLDSLSEKVTQDDKASGKSSLSLMLLYDGI